MSLKRAVACASACAALLAATAVRAQPDNDPEALFRQAATLSRDGRCGEAIPLLEQSFARQPSPNSLLILARCLRDVDRREEAWVRYGATMALADQEIASGQLRYEATRAVAASEREALGKRLAILTVHVYGADATTQVVTDAFRTPFPPGGLSELRLELHLRPETRSLTVIRGDGVRIERPLTLDPAKPTEISLSLPPPAAPVTVEHSAEAAPVSPLPAKRAPSAESQGPWVPLGLVGLGVGVLGAATFVVFKMDSDSIYNQIHAQCGNNCPESQREPADRGAREQTIAYVGLAAGAVGLAAGASFLIYGATRPSRAVALRAVALEMGPSAVRLKVSFE